MRTLTLVCALASSLALSADVPAITAPVTDLANVLSAGKVSQLSEQLKAHRKSTGVQLAVLTVDTTDGEPIEAWALRAATAWSGGERRSDDGGLFVLAIKDRRMRIELGYGLEGRVTDLQAEQLLNSAKASLRNGDPDTAVQSVVDGLMELTAGGTMTPEERARLAQEADAARPAIPPETDSLLAYIVTLLAFAIIGRVARSRLNADEPPSKLQVGIVLSVLAVAVELALGVAGLGWFNGWAAVIGSIAGVFFLFQGELLLTFMYPLFLAIFSVIAAMVDDHGLALLVGGGAQLFITIFFTSFVTDLTFGGGSTSFDSTGASSRSSRDWDSGVPWSTGSSSSSSSSSTFGSSSGSSGSSDSSSSGSSYSGDGGSFGGGGASSEW